MAQLARRRADADDDAQRVAERARVDVGAVAADHPVVLEPPQALGHRRRRQADAPAELRQREARVLLQLREQAEVGVVERSDVGDPRDLPLIRRHDAHAYLRIGPVHEPYGAGILCAWRCDRVPPHAYFVVSAVFHYLGPAFAVLLFARVDVLGVAWLRIAVGGARLRALAPAVARARAARRATGACSSPGARCSR